MPYRTDREALELLHAELLSELEALSRKRETLSGLDQAAEEVRRKLVDTQRKLDKLAPKRSLLDNVHVASPCNAEWNDMQGTERVRFCGHCAKNVFNISAMPAPEAEQLLRENSEGSLCIRVHRRSDGTVLTEDCPVGVKKKRIRRLALATVGGGLMAGAGLFAATRETRTMGAYGGLETRPAPTQTAPPPKPAESADQRSDHPVMMGMVARPLPPTADSAEPPKQIPKPQISGPPKR